MFFHKLLLCSFLGHGLGFGLKLFLRSLHGLVPSLFAKILFVSICFFKVILFNTFHELIVFLFNNLPWVLLSFNLFGQSLLVICVFTDVSFFGLLLVSLVNNILFVYHFRLMFLLGPEVNLSFCLFLFSPKVNVF